VCVCVCVCVCGRGLIWIGTETPGLGTVIDGSASPLVVMPVGIDSGRRRMEASGWRMDVALNEEDGFWVIPVFKEIGSVWRDGEALCSVFTR